MKKSLVVLLTFIIVITVVLIGVGVIYKQADEEKQQGLTDIFDVSSDGTIAYVAYNKGKAGIYLQNDKEKFDNPVFELDTEKDIRDIDFSPDGSSLAYVATNKDVESRLESDVYLFTLATLQVDELFSEPALITEIVFDPKDENQLYYLQAGTFENYSPIASAHPHEMDLYSYRISNDEHTQHTEMKKYSMQSLNVSSVDDSAFVQMNDDAHVETADELFETKQRIFQIPLDQSAEISVVGNNDRDEDIYDFIIVPNNSELIFQSVSKTGKSGIFEYELFLYNWESGDEKQLTYLKESASRPVIGSQGEQVFFIVDMQFGKRLADYRLYMMDLDGKNVGEVSLDFGLM